MQKKIIVELYKELAQKATTEIETLNWADLWHNQVNFLENEHPFPTPAIFFGFRLIGKEDMGEKVQKLRMQVDTYIFYETFADTYEGSWNQESALVFIGLVDEVYAIFHGKSGVNFSEMQRIGFSPIDTGSAGNLYLQSFECVCIDYGAMIEYDDVTLDEVTVTPTPPPPEEDTEEEEKIFIIG